LFHAAQIKPRNGGAGENYFQLAGMPYQIENAANFLPARWSLNLPLSNVSKESLMVSP
jgi:hypothetical protein